MKVTIMRNKGYFGKFRIAKIIADNKEIGLIHSGETISLNIPKQAKNLYIKMDWGRSKPYQIKKLRDGQTIYINAWFSFNILRGLSLMSIPIAFENKLR